MSLKAASELMSAIFWVITPYGGFGVWSLEFGVWSFGVLELGAWSLELETYISRSIPQV